MAKKGLLITGLVIGVMLAIGGFAGMPIINSTLLEPEMAGAMTALRDEGQTEVKWLVYEDFTDDLLLEALDEVNETLQGEGVITLFINGSVAMELLYGNMMNATVGQYFDFGLTTGMLFNAPDYFTQVADNSSYPYIVIDQGVTESAPYYGSISPTPYVPSTMNYLLQGRSGMAPGILEEDFGGYPGFIAFYEAVGPGVNLYLTDPGNTTLLVDNGLTTAYNTTVDNLISFFGYVFNYLVPTVNPHVQTIISASVGFTVPVSSPANAYNYIKLQWGTKALLPDGLVTLDQLADGYEVGLVNSFNSFQEILDLYDPNNEYSLTNEDGIKIWVNASREEEGAKDKLIDGTGLSASVVQEILDWYNSETGFELFAKNNIADLILDEEGIVIPTDDDFYLHLLLLQWERMLLSDEPVELEGVSGLEVDLPEEDWLADATRWNLWDDDFEYALTTEAGMEIWLKAAKEDEDAIAELKDGVPLTESQIAAIGEWILYMRDEVLPTIAEQEGDIPSPVYTLLKTLQESGTIIGIVGLILAGAFVVALKKN